MSALTARAAVFAALFICACGRGDAPVNAAQAPAGRQAAAAPRTSPAPPARRYVRNAVTPPGQLGATLDPNYLPATRAGLWRHDQTTGTGQRQTTQQCDDGRQHRLNLGPACRHLRANRTTTGGYAFSARCRGNGEEGRMDMRAEGDFQTYYSLEIFTRRRGPNGEVSQRMHAESTYVGPCPAGGANRRPQGSNGPVNSDAAMSSLGGAR